MELLLSDALFHKPPAVAAIYAGLMTCLGLRLWLTLRLLTLPRPLRGPCLRRNGILIGFVVDIPVLLGVLGTLFGIVLANFAAQAGTPEAFLKAFQAAFGVAVQTTLLGGLVHIVCYGLSTLDARLVREEN